MRLEKLKEAHPEAEEVELWAEDESRLGLKPVIRRVWAPVGKRPVLAALPVACRTNHGTAMNVK